MDKLERYLDEVCHSIGGPRSLRQHLRRELEEHLRDAVARHRSTGLSDDEALERALVEFGDPGELRGELVAMHGQRMISVLIDKALQWKEKTMRAKWLWMSWAHLALVLVIAVEVALIAFVVMFIAPKFEQVLHDGLLDPKVQSEPAFAWMMSFLDCVWDTAERHATILAIVVAAGWALFEWRVHSDNKSFIRLSGLGTAALGLAFIVAPMAASLLVVFCLGLPEAGRVAGRFAIEQTSKIEASLDRLDEALSKSDWDAMQKHAEGASEAIKELAGARSALAALTPRRGKPTTDEVLEQLGKLHDDLVEAQNSIRAKNLEGVGSAMKKVRESYGPIREAASRAAK
jgi:hypothetical protein